MSLGYLCWKQKIHFFRENIRATPLIDRSEGIINRSVRPPSIRPCKIYIHITKKQASFQRKEIEESGIGINNSRKLVLTLSIWGLILDQIVEGMCVTVREPRKWPFGSAGIPSTSSLSRKRCEWVIFIFIMLMPLFCLLFLYNHSFIYFFHLFILLFLQFFSLRS